MMVTSIFRLSGFSMELPQEASDKKAANAEIYWNRKSINENTEVFEPMLRVSVLVEKAIELGFFQESKPLSITDCDITFI